jgi:histidine triad (HIT) family protein
MDCVFCKIIAKQIPNFTVYEDDNVLAFLDIFPHAKGHTVVVPKKHYENLVEMPIVEWQNIAVGLKKVSDKIQTALKPSGINIGINDRSPAGQVVPHVHWHIFPRYDGDGGGSVHSIIKNPGEIKVEEIAKMF